MTVVDFGAHGSAETLAGDITVVPPKGPDEIDRMADGLLAAVRDCGCGHAGVALLSGYDVATGEAARTVAARLHDHPWVTVTRHFTGEVNSDRLQLVRHWCAIGDFAVGSVNAAAVAARAHGRLITLAESAERGTTSVIPVLRSSSAVSPVAITDYRITPNQPERGQLSILLDGETEHVLAPGTGMRLRCEPEAMVIDIRDHHRTLEVAVAKTVQVRQLRGLHPLKRDGFRAGDLPGLIEFTHDVEGYTQIAV